MTNGSLVDWIRTHGHSVAALDLDAPLDDLAPLAEIVGSARVVGLGESSHHVREFYQVRHRMLRFLVERCGFTVFAVEAPFTGSELLDDWLGGAPAEIEEVAAAIPLSLGEVPELHDVLHWLRTYNRQPGSGTPVSTSPAPRLTATRAGSDRGVR